MNLRYARHTSDLARLIEFYSQVIGLEVLGDFEQHSGYDGVFLGLPQQAWHLEFTTSMDNPDHVADPDDLLVFYVYSTEEYRAIQKQAHRLGVKPVVPKNPYWKERGTQYQDPDGYGVVVVVKQRQLHAEDSVTSTLRDHGIDTWDSFLEYIRDLPYGRNSSRVDPALVISEGRGTCSSKHALIKQIADANGIQGVELILSIFKMTAQNTPAIATVLAGDELDYIPEAHCYLKVNNKRVDISHGNADIQRLYSDILVEETIEPRQVVDYKIQRHREYLQDWLTRHQIDRSLDDIWNLRERCISELQKQWTPTESIIK